MEISITYKDEGDAPEIQRIDHLVADCITYSGITVVLYSSDVEGYWSKVIQCTQGMTPVFIMKEDKQEHLITFLNGSTIQVKHTPITKKPLCDGGDSRDWSINNRTNEQLYNEWK